MEIVDASISFYNSIFEGLVVQVLSALVIIILGLIFGRLVGKLVSRLIYETDMRILFRGSRNLQRFEKAISALCAYFVYFISIIIALRILGLANYFLYLVAVVILVIIALITLLAIKDFFPNFISGHYVREQNMFGLGDIISAGRIKGKVSRMGLTQIVVKTENDEIIHIPYYLLAHEKIKKV